MNTQDPQQPPIREQWLFIYEDCFYPKLKEYPSGYYLNIKTGDKRSFKEGISQIVGKQDELYVYNQWWFDQ
jgi:hypothetical protein|tara:strand:+ start:601 stop:813 length:213 start_codon:yes stop_codon:yes gene_type:complete